MNSNDDRRRKVLIWISLWLSEKMITDGIRTMSTAKTLVNVFALSTRVKPNDSFWLDAKNICTDSRGKLRW